MKIYLVRHGESESNSSDIRQDEDCQLTQKGREQAEILAERFKNIPIDCLVVSTIIRAKQTAEIINRVINKPVLAFSDLFRERRDPSEFFGKEKYCPFVADVYDQINEKFGDKDWHYSDEENFYDFKARALKALEYLKTIDSENILVATHGFFMRMLIACAIFGQDLKPETYWRMMLSFKTFNTGITVLETNHKPFGLADQPDWTLVTWNDHAHLGEIKK